jgi:hypothetical protein
MARSILIYSLVFLFLCGCSNRNNEETVSQNVTDEAGKAEVENGKLELQVDVNVIDHQAEFIITLTNNTKELKKLEFPTSQKYEIIVTDENDREVYRYSEGKMFTQAFEYALIKQGESIHWQELWEVPNEESKYEVEVSIVASDSKELVNKQVLQITE